jgi:hypothetical protein
MPTPATFRELFEAWLEESIAAGGDVSSIVALVSIYQDRSDSPPSHLPRLARPNLASLPPMQPAIEAHQAGERGGRPGALRLVLTGRLRLGVAPVPGWRAFVH